MKLTDYVMNFLVKENIKHVFGITGVSAVHLFDSAHKNKNIEYICNHHEQASAMAIDAYSRLTGNLGVVMTTSGPGATNLLTGTCCSYFDSIPILCLTGQVPTNQSRKGFKARQIGFQETDIVDIYGPVTKYSKSVENSKDIRYELEKAIHIAKSGRPGPVLLDLPDDIQRADVDINTLRGFFPKTIKRNNSNLEEKIDYVVRLVEKSKRPVIISGAGVKLAKAEAKTKKLVEKLKFPVALTWATKDTFPHDYPLVIEGFGVSSGRAGNFAVQNSDLILAMGTKLDTHETGNNLSSFAREAKKIVVDIDKGELEKYKIRGMKDVNLINHDINSFLDGILKRKVKTKDISSWTKRIDEWKKRYPLCLPEYSNQKDKVNPYVFLDTLSKETKTGDVIITDAGATLTWTMQSYKVKKDQKLFSAFNHSPMGYAVPATIGAYYATKRPIICTTGDGGLMMNIQELAIIKDRKLPIKMFVFNNNGYGIIQQTQDTWLNSLYAASNPSSGIAIPNFEKLSYGFEIKYVSINNHDELKRGIRETLDYKGPVLCDIKMNQHEKIKPKLSFGGSIEDSEPQLPRKEFLENMIIKPLS